ncbi:TCR/Tet family MFS transporter [Defluviimonas sp. SAOS-178_SWC]|uniref:TCR/Tet family MFS transporter n=1 Tax=Defluviimonas sp. SAOS-178_SWC TaxID=3121287 RepID=UPI0032216958
MQNRLALIFILTTVMIDSIGIGIIFPVMPELMREVTGADLSTASLWGGVLATSFAVMQFLCGPVVGNLSDRYGRRPVMLIALAVMAVDYLIMAVAGTVWLLLVGRIVAGAAAATYSTANAYVADISAPDQRAKNFGFIGAAFGLGFIAGPLLGGIAAEWGTRAPFWAAAAIAALNALFGLVALPESLRTEKRRPFSLARANPFGSFRAIGHLPGLKRLLAIMFLYTVAFQSYPSIWAFFGTERFGWDAWWNGLSLALFGGCMVVVQGFLVAPAIRIWGDRSTAAYGMSLEVVTFGFYGFVTSGFWALVFTPIASVAGIAGPALSGIMANATPDDQQGELQGVIASVSAIAMGLAPMVMTSVFWAFTHEGATHYLPGAPFLLSGLLMVASVIVLVVPARERAAA